MTSVRARWDSWTVPPVVVALAIVAVIAAVLVVEIGSKLRQTHAIPSVQSVTICTAPPTESPCSAPGSRPVAAAFQAQVARASSRSLPLTRIGVRSDSTGMASYSAS
jgi:hypothetical protein